MSARVQRVVVIQDASRDVSPSAIRWVLQDFSLKPGDVLTLFGVLHQVNNPMGYKVKVDSSSMFGVNPKFIAEEVARKIEEYSNNEEIKQISKQCEMEQIEFLIEVQAGSTPKVVALKAAKSLKATWVILDRQMKKDKKFFMEKLSCGISRMKRNNTIEQLRGPKSKVEKKVPKEKRSTSNGKSQVRYDEMIPEMMPRRISPHIPQNHSMTSSEKELISPSEDITHQNHKKSPSFSRPSTSDQLIKATASSSRLAEVESIPMNLQEEGITMSTKTEITGEQSPFSAGDNQQRDKKEAYNIDSSRGKQNQQINTDDWMGRSPTDEVFKNSICSCCNNRRPKIGWKRDFTYAELHAATEGFAFKNFLSEGGFGSVYMGELNGLKVAVKQYNNASFQGEKEFKSEVHVLSKARHENLVMLLGSCSEGSHRLLVYEYVCNGSLDQHLSKHTRMPLSWEKRMKISMGAAKGLQYLHENNIIHRDMRPNNILITHDHDAMLGDFGLATTQHEDSDQSLETRVVGTLGYLAPEYAECGKVSTKTDVYAFGVVLLQLITGLKTTDKILGGKSLVGWARPLLKERNYPDLIDHRIIDSHDVHQLFWMVRVAERCLCKDPQKRLTMEKVVYALNHIIKFKASCIRDISPPQSDDSPSPISIRDSDDSQYEDDDDDTSIFTSEASLASSISHTSLMLPPSPPLRLPTSPPPVLAIASTGSNASSVYYRSSLGGGNRFEWDSES